MDNDKEIRALRNIRMVAARQINRHNGGRATLDGSYADWKHVLRFCEDAGIIGSILRGQATEERKAAESMRRDMYGENGNG